MTNIIECKYCHDKFDLHGIYGHWINSHYIEFETEVMESTSKGLDVAEFVNEYFGGGC